MKNLRNQFFFFLSGILMLIIVGLLFSNKLQKLLQFEVFSIKTIETTHSLILEQSKSLGNIELASYSFKDIVEQKLVRDYLPDPEALLIVYGEAIACIDLTEIKRDNIEIKGDSLVIYMPNANLCTYKIDHSKSYIYDTKYAFMNEDLLFEEAYRSAENKLKETALNSGLLKKAENNAEKILVPLFENISERKVSLIFNENK